MSKGAVLEVLDIEIEAIRYRNTGREIRTRYAKKMQKIRTYFTVAANQISDAEMKTVYMQIINENGELIQGNELQTTVVADSTVECTSVANFEYNNIDGPIFGSIWKKKNNCVDVLSSHCSFIFNFIFK